MQSTNQQQIPQLGQPQLDQQQQAPIQPQSDQQQAPIQQQADPLQVVQTPPQDQAAV